MRFLRYPGGKYKLISFLLPFLPKSSEIKGKYIEPFLGGGSIFFFIKPKKALLSDLNKELIELYKGITNYSHKVWEIYQSFPSGKKSYYKIRDNGYKSKHLSYRAARTLYLNRTCFKGMWRHNLNGDFNVGYGGEERRWVINHNNLVELSAILNHKKIECKDFEDTLSETRNGDFIFLDPPYKPGLCNLIDSHYINNNFSFSAQKRLSEILIKINNKKQIKWLMTNSSHSDICKLYKAFRIRKIPKGTSERIGIQTEDSKEILISNF